MLVLGCTPARGAPVLRTARRCLAAADTVPRSVAAGSTLCLGRRSAAFALLLLSLVAAAGGECTPRCSGPQLEGLTRVGDVLRPADGHCALHLRNRAETLACLKRTWLLFVGGSYTQTYVLALLQVRPSARLAQPPTSAAHQPSAPRSYWTRSRCRSSAWPGTTRPKNCRTTWVSWTSRGTHKAACNARCVHSCTTRPRLSLLRHGRALTSHRRRPRWRAQLVGARGSWDKEVPPLPLMEDASWGGLRLTMVTARHWDGVQEALATALNGTNSAAWQGRRKIVFLQSGTWYLELQKARRRPVHPFASRRRG